MKTYKQIAEFPNYEIADDGTIRNRTTMAIKSQYLGSTRYYFVTLHRDNANGKPRRVHRLIAAAFIPNPHNKPEINHKDGNRTNNHISNLEWCTHPENMRHAFKTGLVNNTGERNGQSKLIPWQVSAIKERLRHGESQYSIASDYPVSRSCILGIKIGRLWGHIK